MLLSQYDTSKMLYNLNLLPERRQVIDFWPELQAFEEFRDVIDNDIKLSFLLADIESPFLKIKDPSLRLQAMFEALEIGLKAPKNQEYFNHILDYKLPRVNACCARYLHLLNNHEYTYWWNLNQLYYNTLMKEMGKPMSTTDDLDAYVNRNLKIQEKAEKIIKILKEKEAILFNDAALKRAIVNAEMQKIRTYPEMHAQENSVF